MKIRAIALNTFGSLLRERIIILCCAVFACVLLVSLVMMSESGSSPRGQSTAFMVAMGLISFVSGLGSLLAAWSAASVVAREVTTGTILAVLARPVHRWEYLLGKFIGVQMLMMVFVTLLCSFTYLLAWQTGQKINAPIWVLIVYPIIRYAVWSALAMMLGVRLHPMLSVAIIVVLSVAIPIAASHLPAELVTALYTVLPVTIVLGETRFIELSKASLTPVPWSDHATALAYGLDHALVFFLVAVLLFHSRSLTFD